MNGTRRRALLAAGLLLAVSGPLPPQAPPEPPPGIAPAPFPPSPFPAARVPSPLPPVAATALPPALRLPRPAPARGAVGRRLWHAGAVPPGPTDEARARAALARHADRLGLDAVPGSLECVEAFRSPVGTHVRFRQVVAGIPVEGGEASVHWAPDGRILVVNADLFPVPAAAPAPVLAAVDAGEAAAAFLGAAEEAPDAPELSWLPAGRTARLAWRTVVRGEGESLEVFVDALDGSVLRAEDLRRSAEGTGKVFEPNPVWSTRNASLVDGGDADTPALEAALGTVALLRLDGSGYLRGEWVDLTPTKPRAFEPSQLFLYNRSDPRFEQVNAYYHLDALQQYVHGTLGFTGAAGLLRVDAHHGKVDNSYYDISTRRLLFGDGGVDDAEDGDIVAHEYGHALQDAQVRRFGRSVEAGSMGEGFGDYIAATRRSSGDDTWDAAVGSWDATAFSFGFPPALRRVDGSLTYPANFSGEVHESGQIWSSALWEIRRQLGAEAADRVIIGSHFLLTNRARFAEGAAAVVAANLSLRGGAGEAGIRDAFAARGIPVGDDPLEEDDSPAAATPVDASLFEGLYAADDDWFLLRALPGAGVAVAAVPGIPGQVPAVELYDGSLRLVDVSSRFSPEAVVSNGALGAAAPFYVRVSPGRRGPGPYALVVQGDFAAPAPDRFEPDDAMETAAPLPTGAAVRIHLDASDEDWFVLEGTQGATVEASAVFDAGALDADLALFAPDGSLLAESSTTGSPETIEHLVLGVDAPRVFLRAKGISGTGTADLLAFVRPGGDALGRAAVKAVLEPDREMEFRVAVPVEAGAAARVRIVARRFGKDGAVPEVEVVSPSGIAVAPFGAGAGSRGATVDVAAPEPGDWRVRVRSVDGSGGGIRVKARVR